MGSIQKICKSCGALNHHHNAKYCWKCGESFTGSKYCEEVNKALVKFKNDELKSIKQDKKKGIPVRINPNSLIGKEILYQTTILKNIERNLQKLELLKMMENK